LTTLAKLCHALPVVLILVTSIALVSPSWAQTQKKRGGGNPLANDVKAIENGKQLFAGACSACHGPNGEGGRGPSLADGRQVRRASDQQLFNSIKNGVPGSDMPPFPLPDEKIWQLVAFARSLSAPALASRPPGDVQAGRELFFGKGGCSTCHMIRGEGGFPGPDLSDIGATRTLEQLREALLDPNARPAEDFRGVTVVTRDGRRVEGVAKYHGNYEIQILDAKGKLHLFSTKDLQEIAFRDKSLMPDDYGRRLTPHQIDDLLAFLSRQSVREGGTP
jgi:cytochrome c oxidase cbb3-type subunit 3